MTNELEIFVNDLSTQTKVAEADLANLSIHELESIIGLHITEDAEKLAYLEKCIEGGGRDGGWLGQFEGTQLHAKAIQLCEEELAVEQQRLERRLQREQDDSDKDLWTREDMIRLQKRLLELELAKSRMSGAAGVGGRDPSMQPMLLGEGEAQAAAGNAEPKTPPAAKPKEPGKTPGSSEGKTKEPEKKAGLQGLIERYGKTASDVQMVGQINNGDPNPPSWPRAALGINVPAVRAEIEADARSPMPNDIAQPQTGSKTAVSTKWIADRIDGAVKGKATKELGRLGKAVHPDDASRLQSLAKDGIGHAHRQEVLAAPKSLIRESLKNPDKGISDYKHFVRHSHKEAGAATQLGEAVLSRVHKAPELVQRGLGKLTQVGQHLGGKTTESAVGRGLMAAGGTALGAGALASRKTAGLAPCAAPEGRHGRPFQR